MRRAWLTESARTARPDRETRPNARGGGNRAAPPQPPTHEGLLPPAAKGRGFIKRSSVGRRVACRFFPIIVRLSNGLDLLTICEDLSGVSRPRKYDIRAEAARSRLVHARLKACRSLKTQRRSFGGSPSVMSPQTVICSLCGQK